MTKESPQTGMLSEERLAALREANREYRQLGGWAVEDLFGHIDALAAEAAQLRQRVEAARLHVESAGRDVDYWLKRAVDAEARVADLERERDAREQSRDHWREQALAMAGAGEAAPVSLALWCPKCGAPHVDEGEWATTRRHKTHLCLSCGRLWRPFEYPTVGVPHVDPPAPAPPPVQPPEAPTTDSSNVGPCQCKYCDLLREQSERRQSARVPTGESAREPAPSKEPGK